MTEILEPEKLELTTLDIAAEKQADLLRLFPEIRTEDGKIDFDRLRLALGETVDVGKERYGMNWPGKADCFKAIQRPSLGTLLPVRGESVNFDETENLIIEGDNLEVLKLLQKSYQSKVKMIYIDPPYNTGNDFIYPDNYSESLQTYLEYTGQVDNEGNKFSNNTETDGRFHSKWLNMMYPRLYLARNLLREDGVIFVSIDDAEVDNLRLLCNEVFGEENFIAQLVVLTNPKGRVMDRNFSRTHDYVVAYSKGFLETELSLPKTDEQVEEDYPESDEGGAFRALELRNTHRQFGRFNRPKLWYPLFVDPTTGNVSTQRFDAGIEVLPRWDDGFEGCWTWGTDKAHNEQNLLVGRMVNGRWKVFRKAYSHSKDGEVARKKLKTILIDSSYYTERGQAAFDELIPERIFQSPKPVALIDALIRLSTNEDDLILDFFAGSGTSGQAVLEINKLDESTRKFILVQLPEPTGREDFKTISAITKERVRRLIQRTEAEAEGKLTLGNLPKQGFRAMTLAKSNFRVWSSSTETTTPEALGQQLELHIDHVQAGRSSEDLLYEILLKSGFPLTTPVQSIAVEGIPVYSVANGAMLICLEKALTHEAVRGMAELKPERVVCLDEGFAGNDQLKTNAVLIMKAKGVTKFQTV